MKKCSECEYGKSVNVQHTGVGASSHMGTFSRDEWKCTNPNNEKWYEYFSGKTHPRSCPLEHVN